MLPYIISLALRQTKQLGVELIVAQLEDADRITVEPGN